jgi:excisionase family DNA binding protein
VKNELHSYPDPLTVVEAADVLRISVRSAYAAIQRGEIRAIRIGRILRVPKSGLAELLGREQSPK